MQLPAMKYPLSREQLLELYYYMRLTRELDEQLVRLFRQNKVVGGLYSSLGQEATAVGTAYALEPRDWMAPMIRNVGGLLVKGYRPRDIFMQYMARYDSPTHGKDNTSHFGDLKVRHVVSPISMLGDLIPVMTGVALAGRYLGQKIVAMTWIGDGGTSTGAFHEGLNFAAVQRAPLVLVIENNQWAYSTPVARQVPLRHLVERGRAYGLGGYIVDGNDVIAVYQVTREAVERARNGEGPVLIEAKTMRMKGHAQHDPASYVPPEMFEFWKARDPITRYEQWLTRHGVWDEATRAAINERVARELRQELAEAEASPPPPPELAEQGVYCEGCHQIEPEWQRPVEELLPPRSSVQPRWTVTDFGAFDGACYLPAETPAVAPAPAAASPARTPATRRAAGARRRRS
jgi:pyruvate dehydrogenase E1 component alpha subunit/2-oxoisovalerate dehydrogenase E1 component alpha subunit